MVEKIAKYCCIFGRCIDLNRLLSLWWSSSRWQNNKTVSMWFIKRLKCPFHLEPDKEAGVRAGTPQEDPPSNGAVARNPSSLDTISPFAWDITPPYETSKNSCDKPEQKLNSNLCVVLWPPRITSRVVNCSRFCPLGSVRAQQGEQARWQRGCHLRGCLDWLV